MQELKDLSCQEFLERLSGKSPTPGGGSTSALVGALGMALGNMVVSLTLGKAKYADAQAELEILHVQSRAVQAELAALIQKDVLAFEPLAAAYALPSGTVDERAEKAQQMEAHLKAAAEVPLDIMKQCIKAIELHDRYRELGSKLAISDVGAGVVMCAAALEGANLNVLINTKMMEDRASARRLNDEAKEMLILGTKKAADIYTAVEKMLK